MTGPKVETHETPIEPRTTLQARNERQETHSRDPVNQAFNRAQYKSKTEEK